MAAYGGQEAIAALGNQIFCMIKCGQQPPEVISLRAPYEATVQALRGEISKVAGVPADQLQLFHRGHELPSDDTRTLLDLDLHTGFSLHCYNLTEEPVYWPPVERGQDGLLHVMRHYIVPATGEKRSRAATTV